MKWFTRTKYLAFTALINLYLCTISIANLSEILVLKTHPVQMESMNATKIAGKSSPSAFRV